MAETTTPMLAQFQALKREHPDCLLFFRLGDFYEMFFEDATLAAPALDIALTRRGRHGGEDIPMCGVPVHSADGYLERLIRKGFRVAICEQTEDPALARKRGGKTIVARAVVRVVTPGTLTEDSLLEARRHNYLAALAEADGALGLAWLDISTGSFETTPTSRAALPSELARLDPGEVIVPERLFGQSQEVPGGRAAEGVGSALRELGPRVTPLSGTSFDGAAAERRLKAAFGVAALEGFGTFTAAEIGASGALIDYVEVTQKGRLPPFAPPRRLEPGSHLVIDPSSRRNLELLQGVDGGRKGSLLAAVDRTVTGAGGRLLAARIAAPLAQPEAIRSRLDEVSILLQDADLRRALRSALRGCPDLERALSRLSLQRGGPRDLAAIREGLARAAEIRDHLGPAGVDELLGAKALPPLDDLLERLAAALADQPPILARDGGAIRGGFDPDLDRERDLRDQGRRHIVALERRLQDQTGIASLKIRHNGMLGYFVEVTATHRAKVPAHFVQRQSMANATRYATEELVALASGIESAGEQALQIELRLVADLVSAVVDESSAVAAVASALARLDVAAGLAELAHEGAYVRPEIEGDTAFTIAGGRHPVVEQALAFEAKPFIANDADLAAARRLWLLTGPNMAGKSTFLRQNALIAILAQAGSFVPAKRARIGVVDRLFSRVGAADDLARGRSTFMVEMVETAAILNQATDRSLVILDEIGRGTATFDGLSIAWAVVEHLHEVTRCRAIFATHFHELTALSARLDRLAIRTMRVKEWAQEVIFLHEVGEGAADRSYGIHVARLAGLPPSVLTRAEQVLAELERGEATRAPARLADDLPLFAAARPRSEPRPSEAAGPPAPVREAPPAPPVAASPRAEPSPLEALLAPVDPDELTPKAALDLVYRLRAKLRF